MKTVYIADDGEEFVTEKACLSYEESVVPVFYAVDIYRTGGTRHHHESLLGVYFSYEEAEERISDVSSRRSDDLNQRYEVRTTKMFKDES